MPKSWSHLCRSQQAPTYMTTSGMHRRPFEGRHLVLFGPHFSFHPSPPWKFDQILMEILTVHYWSCGLDTDNTYWSCERCFSAVWTPAINNLGNTPICSDFGYTWYSSVVGLFGAEFFLHFVSLFFLLFCGRYLPLTVAICCGLTDLKDPVSQKFASLLWQHVPIEPYSMTMLF